MAINAEQFIKAQPAERQSVMMGIHAIITQEDKTAVPMVEQMMGKEMIVYKDRGMMKYGLANVKKYMSLHLLPMYMSPTILPKYKLLLHEASFQKGCINFETAEQMPIDIIKQLIADCSVVDLHKIREKYLREKKPKGKAKA